MIARFVLSRQMDLGLELGHQVKRIESYMYVYICNHMYGRSFCICILTNNFTSSDQSPIDFNGAEVTQ
jgi:hypothetical protein